MKYLLKNFNKSDLALDIACFICVAAAISSEVPAFVHETIDSSGVSDEELLLISPGTEIYSRLGGCYVRSQQE